MNIEKRIRQIAAKKIKVIITGKTRNRDGFRVTIGKDDDSADVSTIYSATTKREALSMLLAKLRCSPTFYFKIEPVKITPNPKHKADVPWKRKVL